jgi:hypothetical protein
MNNKQYLKLPFWALEEGKAYGIREEDDGFVLGRWRLSAGKLVLVPLNARRYATMAEAEAALFRFDPAARPIPIEREIPAAAVVWDQRKQRWV